MATYLLTDYSWSPPTPPPGLALRQEYEDVPAGTPMPARECPPLAPDDVVVDVRAARVYRVVRSGPPTGHDDPFCGVGGDRATGADDGPYFS